MDRLIMMDKLLIKIVEIVCIVGIIICIIDIYRLNQKRYKLQWLEHIIKLYRGKGK